MALRPFGREKRKVVKIDMSIQINKAKIKEQVKLKFGHPARAYGANALDFADEVIENAQEYMDSNHWLTDPKIDSKREARLAMKQYISAHIDIRDAKKSWFVPTFIWIWIAKQVIMFIVMMIINNYWSQMAEEKGLE
jgi:hypothetical protein